MDIDETSILGNTMSQWGLALLVFIINGQVNYLYGLILSAGSIIGALIASYLAVKKGAVFIRAIIVLSVILTILQITGLVNFTELLKKII